MDCHFRSREPSISSMENFIPLLLDLLSLLVDTYRIYPQNGRLLASIALLFISLQTMLLLFNFFSIKPLLTDLIIKQTYLLLTSPGTPEFTNIFVGLMKDLKIFLGVEWVFLLSIAIASFFFAISTIHASALIHGGKNLSIKDFVWKTIRSLKRPLVTCFYISLLGNGYTLLCLVPIVLTLGNQPIYILLSISTMVFHTYLSVVWGLSLVVSILEDRFGIEALGKAAQIVKGARLQGFILNLLLALLSLILLQSLRLITFTQSRVMGSVFALVVLNLIALVRMFGYAAYTVLYYQCKKTHGEEVELQAEMEYTKIPIPPLISENIP